MHALMSFVVFLLPAMAAASEVGRVLSLCLDTTATPKTRIDALLDEGWTESGDDLEALATAITLIRINAGDPTNWNAERDTSRELAVEALKTGDTRLLEAPDGSVAFIGRDARRLQTCLYLGAELDLEPVDEALDASFVRQIGEVFRIRGEGVKSLVSAHGMTDAGRDRFDPPLPFAMFFSVRLDRQPGD